MFVHPDMIVLVYCDDCLMFTREQSTVDSMIVRMRKACPGGITVEDSVFAFLGVEVLTDSKTGKTKLAQSGLIDSRNYQASGLQLQTNAGILDHAGQRSTGSGVRS
jgi:hypothetical protein